jgi:ketosteroid isomerase-like protein
VSREDLETLVRELTDREAIRDLAARYAHAVWLQDPEAAVALFAPDGVMDTGDRPPIRGSDALRTAYQAMVGGAVLRPFVHDHRIELHGDRATGRCHLDLRGAVDGHSWIGTGHYEDAYVRIGSAWKFQSRKLVMHSYAPVEQGWAEMPAKP